MQTLVWTPNEDLSFTVHPHEWDILVQQMDKTIAHFTKIMKMDLIIIYIQNGVNIQLNENCLEFT